MTAKMTRVRINRELVEEAMRAIGAKSRTEAVRVAIKGVVGLEKSQRSTGVPTEGSSPRETKAKG